MRSKHVEGFLIIQSSTSGSLHIYFLWHDRTVGDVPRSGLEASVPRQVRPLSRSQHEMTCSSGPRFSGEEP